MFVKCIKTQRRIASAFCYEAESSNIQNFFIKRLKKINIKNFLRSGVIRHNAWCWLYNQHKSQIHDVCVGRAGDQQATQFFKKPVRIVFRQKCRRV
jgi:hypothetical protein